MVHPIHFSPTSVQFKDEINGASPLCKRRQKQHLEFLTAFLRTRRPGVRIPPGAPLRDNKTKMICIVQGNGRAWRRLHATLSEVNYVQKVVHKE